MELSVVIAPDKCKGTLTAAETAMALAQGWRRSRPDDRLTLLPMADGGDGTAEVLAMALPDASWVTAAVVDALGRHRLSRYLRSGQTAVVELAAVCGLAGLETRSPMESSTIGLGLMLAAAIEAGATRLVVGLGGSASTDGGLGALTALGARSFDANGELISSPNGATLAALARVELDGLVALPSGGVQVLVDVSTGLFGATGAAAVFGPQKGASPAQVAELDLGLRRLAGLLGGDASAPGTGAAGGTGYGLGIWGARLTPGASTVAELIGLGPAIAQADVVITGEGRFDESSLAGKVCGHVIEAAAGRQCYVVAGSVSRTVTTPAGVRSVDVSTVARSRQRARTEPSRWFAAAAAAIAGGL